MGQAMAETALQNGDRLALARALVNHLEEGDNDGAGSVLAELAGFTDSQLFQEVGRLTRELHNSINSFVMEARLSDIAESDMPDAAERLRYVIATTEQAANTTLGAVEDSLPLANSLRSGAEHLSRQWKRFNSRELSVDDFRELSVELSHFLEVTQANSEELHNKLSEVLMAQDYQDLTGQVIRKVIDLVNDVEHKLVELVRLSGGQAIKDRKKDKGGTDTQAAGPAVPNVDKVEDRVNSQDDVDDLLSSLGF
jgi:chemotaxis protein CheZ